MKHYLKILLRTLLTFLLLEGMPVYAGAGRPDKGLQSVEKTRQLCSVERATTQSRKTQLAEPTSDPVPPPRLQLTYAVVAASPAGAEQARAAWAEATVPYPPVNVAANRQRARAPPPA
ncbi:MAG: hypothetical protein LBR29_02305 [Methylobacteriaceae bacterium]|nr:hypothetical protein [Methylobacteriaceae bacterium]